ncbi:MAG: sensor domain-containing diguanylate cyclase [Chloroflexi bacterium]|nr:sensor domain-containing diguanylate cyclase [Chloroflexota bacterium]
MEYHDHFYKNLVDNLFEGVFYVDTERRITYWNKSAERISGYCQTHVVGNYCFNNGMCHINEEGVQLCQTGCPLTATLQDGQMRKMEVYLQHAHGYRVPVIIHTSPILDDQGKIIGAVETFTDNKDMFLTRKRMQSLSKELEFDKLTGVSSRRSTNACIKAILKETHTCHHKTGVLFIDIDHFKLINDTYGHEVGDQVLSSVAQTMRHALRSTDFLGRWGGEEFLLVIYNSNSLQLMNIAEKLRLLVTSSKVVLNNTKIGVTISGGMTTVQENDTSKILLERVDQLLYESKSKGRNSITFG